jgi:hypothetical protein
VCVCVCVCAFVSVSSEIATALAFPLGIGTLLTRIVLFPVATIAAASAALKSVSCL